MRTGWIAVLAASAVLCAGGAAAQTAAQTGGFLRAEGARIVDETGRPVVLRGMGLGGWVLQSDGLLKHCTKNAKHTPTSATELYELLRSPSRPTFPTAKAVAFYPAAPGDLADLVAAGKLIYLEHYKFVAAPPDVHTANAKLRAYWMEHIASGLRSSLADGMP